jgi:hypothetical protein
VGYLGCHSSVAMVGQCASKASPAVRYPGTVVLRLRSVGVTMVLQWCYSGVTEVLQWCYSGVTVVLPPVCSLLLLGGRLHEHLRPCAKKVTDK